MKMKYYTASNLFAARVKRYGRNPFRTVSMLWAKNPVKAKTAWGDEMLVLLPEMKQLYLSGCYEGIEERLFTQYMLDHLKEGDVVFDIGANVGFFSLLSAHLVGERGRVYAFEPTPSTFAILAENAKGKNIMPLKNAVWSSDTTLKLKLEDRCGLNRICTDGSLPVQAISLDSCFGDVNPTFVKIDAEFAEEEILKGMEKMIARAKPVIGMETLAPDTERFAALKKRMEGYGYQLTENAGGNSIFTHA